MNLPISLAIKLYGTISMLKVDSEAQSTKTKEKNIRYDVTHIMIGQKLDQIFIFFFFFSNLFIR